MASTITLFEVCFVKVRKNHQYFESFHYLLQIIYAKVYTGISIKISAWSEICFEHGRAVCVKILSTISRFRLKNISNNIYFWIIHVKIFFKQIHQELIVMF